MEEKYMPVRKSSDNDEPFRDRDADHSVESLYVHPNPRGLSKTKFVTQVLLLFTCLAFLANLYLLFWNSTRRLSLERGLYPKVVPPIPLETISFEEDELYASPPSPAAEQAWSKLMPAGLGFIFVQDAQERGLPGHGESTPWGEIFSVTVFHQIHCLTLLRKNYYEAFERAFDQNDLEELKQFASTRMNDEHANHCFDYLRQSLQCAADMSLEWPKPGTQIVNGWGMPHLCRSWDAVMEYMEENHSNGTAVEKHDHGGARK